MKHFFSLLLLAVFVIAFPVIRSSGNSAVPEVKALYTSEPVLPTLRSKVISPELSATSVFVLDLDSGSVLFSKEPHLQLKPASLTKIMTAVVAMDYYSEDTILKVINGQKSLGSSIDLLGGDRLLARDLFSALLIPSGNDAALTLAENYLGGYNSFVNKMNESAASLGLENTHFVNVSGVEAPSHFTSAYDISMIVRAALQRPLFASIVSTKKLTLKSLEGNKYSFVSTNVLLDKPGFLGVKTGWTPEAGECLVVLYEQDGHKILISILHSSDRFGEGEKLAHWVFANFTWQ